MKRLKIKPEIERNKERGLLYIYIYEYKYIYIHIFSRSRIDTDSRIVRDLFYNSRYVAICMPGVDVMDSSGLFLRPDVYFYR